MAENNEVVISGIGGLFPECNNMNELKNLLFSKTNGITVDSRRWNPNELGVTAGTGKIKPVDKFDTVFFSAHPKLAEVMDPLTKLSLERSIEAVIDAGLSPADLHGTNTAVFMGSAISETEMLCMDCSKNAGFSMLGRSRTMQANRVSYILNLTGPSFAMDGGWICGSNGLQKAKEMIEKGYISSAIVGVTNLALRPEIQFQFHGLNRLNRSDRTKPFSSDADGYNRSEACIVMLLQKASEAKRSYGTLLSVKSVQFGDHQGHVTERDGNHLKSLLLDSYKEANVDPATVDFVEANGSGIKSEDSMELNIMEEVFCTQQRKTPLKIGSVKSNVGHCEASGLFVSIVKAIIALESGYIPPNINYAEPNENVGALKTGKIQVITEKTPFNGDVIGISSFGTLNAFSHVVLRRNNKAKNNVINCSNGDNIPRLILASGRNEENTRQTIDKIKSHGNDAEFIALIDDVFTRNINAHFYRSFTVLPPKDNDSRLDDIWNVNLKKRPVWFIFSGMGSQWQGMGAQLMRLPIFADAINKCDSVLKPRGVDIKNILTSQNPKIFDNILNSFVGIAAVQIGLVEVLRALDITPDGIVGHSVGELGCAYADGCFSLEEMILSAYARGRASIEMDLIPGMMAAIGLGYHQIKDILPHDIDVACHNSATSCTISGPVDSINAFVTELKAKGTFAKSVNVAGIAYHSRYIQSAGPTLLKYLKEIIKTPKKRSSKWISSSLPEAEWNSDLAKYSSPEYHTNNLLSSVLFEDSLKHIPSDAIAIEIAPHGLLQAILKSALPDTVSNIPLTKKVYGDSVRFLLTAIGKMYMSGLNPKIKELYPKVTFPVCRGTPSINDFPFWDHTQVWSHDLLTTIMNVNSGEKIGSLVLNDNIHLTQHLVYGNHVIPLSFILFDVWKTFVAMNSRNFAEEPVQFHDLLFKNNVKIHATNASESYLMIQWGSGHFEYSLDNDVIFSGQIDFLEKDETRKTSKQATSLDSSHDDFQGCVAKDEIYAIMENNGLELGEDYKNISDLKMYKNNIQCHLKWKRDWIYFMDGLLKFPLLEHLDAFHAQVPFSVRRISIVPTVFGNNPEKDIFVDYNRVIKEIACAGVKISEVKTRPVDLPNNKSVTMKIEEQTFIHFNRLKFETVNDFIQYSLDIIIEADKLNFTTGSGKLIVCTPYHYNDPISKACTKEIKQIVKNHQGINSKQLNWDSVKDVSEYDESGKFITVTNVNYLQDTFKALANKTLSYVFVCSKQTLRDFKDWKIIAQQEFGDNNHLVLMKKRIVLDGNSVFLKPTNDDYDLSVWNSLEKHKSSKGMIYIISNDEPIEGVSTYVNDMLRKYKSEKLRFLFIIDKNAPDFDSNKSFYVDQLSIGFIDNIYKNGGWGSYKRICLHRVVNGDKVVENPALKNFLFNKNDKLTIKYLGLNFKDLVVDEDTKNEFGLLEYSGLAVNNKMIMGITSFERMSTQINYDPLLMWPVPSTWSLEDATTVPLSYAMSYYVFNVLCTLEKDKSVLITSGLHPIGQAAISISLAEKCNVYAVVDSSHEADRLYNVFPELLRERILVNTNDQFDIKVKMMTNGHGIDVILNFLSGEALHAAFRALADHGRLFNFSKSDMKNHGNLGTRRFLRDLAFSAVGTNMLLNEKDCNKRIVQRAIVDGFNKGVIRPFKSHVLPNPISSDKMFVTMRTALASVTPEKVVLSLNDMNCSKSLEKVESETYQCNPDHIYVIVDHKSDWLDLAEWLVERGAQKVIISLKRCSMSSTTCRRFDRLISRNVSVQLESDSHLQSKEDSLNWLHRLTSSNVLGALFVVNQADDEKIKNLQYSFEKYENKTAATLFVCISSKGDNICNDLKTTGLNALNVSWDGTQSVEPKSTAKILPSLDLLLQKSNTLRSSSFLCSEKGNTIYEWNRQMNDVIANLFPGSVNELHALKEKTTTEACFVEVHTRSPRYSQLKSVTPVFVIPGFRPELVETWYKRIFYPVFEAQLPEHVSSIDELSHALVNQLKSISTDQGYVSLVGESWGGIVALKMAQILEAQGTLVTVALLEGDPETLASWAGSFFSNDNFIAKLNALYNSSFSNEFMKSTQRTCDEDSQLPNMSSYQRIYEENTQKSLNIISSRLQALLQTAPLSNKLHTKVLIFRYERTFECSKTNLNHYCVNPPFVHIIKKTDYKSMMVDKETIETITKNVVHSYSVGVELSLDDKYKNFYFNAEKFFKIIY